MYINSECKRKQNKICLHCKALHKQSWGDVPKSLTSKKFSNESVNNAIQYKNKKGSLRLQ